MPDKKGGARNTISRETILRALKKANYNVTAAAVLLGKSRTWIKDKISKDDQLRESFHDARELVLDDAESALHTKLQSR